MPTRSAAGSARDAQAGAFAWIGTAVFLGAGDVEDMLARPPVGVEPETMDCWRKISRANAAQDRNARALGAESAADCQARGSINLASALPAIVALGDVNAGFDLAKNLNRRSVFDSPAVLFRPTNGMRAMRADARFLPLVKDLGLWDYWVETGTQPDVCETDEEEDFPVSAALRAERAAR